MFGFHFFAMLLGAFIGELLAEWFFEKSILKEMFEPYEERVKELEVLIDDLDAYCTELEKDVLQLKAKMCELKDKA